jgi:hypothetical protein
MKPRLRTVDRYKPPYPLNIFPSDFPLNLGAEIVYLLATRPSPRVEGSDWEEIFSRIIGGRWKPSNVGLDDVLLEQTAWSAKTVKDSDPHAADRVRLICGRNSPAFSFNQDSILAEKPAKIAEMIISIWNERVSAIRAKYAHLRSVVLIKSDDLLDLAAFEYDTVMYNHSDYQWDWNKNSNLVGSINDEHKFTWQPSGSQFTIIEKVPADRLALQIKAPGLLDREAVLKGVKFDNSWVKVLGNRKDEC